MPSITNRRRRRRVNAVVIGQGFVVWSLYEVIKKLARPVRWFVHELRQLVFGWRQYPEYLREQSLVEGVSNGKKGWLAIGAVMWGVWAWRKTLGRSEQVLLREVLGQGEQVVITQVARKPSRKARRAAAKIG
jgi:hypothetical protein